MRPAVLACVLAAFLLPRQAAAAGQETAFCEDVKKPFFRGLSLRDGRTQFLPARGGAAAASFVIPKPAGKKRVFVVGESVAQLLGEPPAPGAEVINCGMGGYNSRRIEAVFGEVLGYAPDLVVLLSGNNEGPEYPCPGAAEDLRRRGAKLKERLYGLVPSGVPAQVRASLAAHSARLDAMAALAAAKKVPLVICTLPANLEMPPPGSLPLESAELARGLYLYEKTDYSAAEKAFAAAAAADKRDLHSRYWLARAQAAQGHRADALENYLKAVELDPAQGRASRTRNELIRRTAARRGAALCDLEKFFASSVPGGIAGFAQFADGVHWRRGYDAAVWREINSAAGAAYLGVPARAGRAAQAEEDELRRTFSYAVSGMDAAAAYGLDKGKLEAGFISEPALAELGYLEAVRPGLAGGLAGDAAKFSAFFIRNSWSAETAGRLEDLRAAFTAHLAELERRRGGGKNALALIDRAISREPEKIYYRLVKAQALYGLGRAKEASDELSVLYAAPALGEKAMAVARARGLDLPPWAGSPREAAQAASASKRISDEGVGLARAGDPAGAAALFRRAAAVYPPNAEARLSLCALDFAGKDYQSALEHCSFAVAAAASYPEGARAGLAADALYLKARALAALKVPAEGLLAAALERGGKDWGRRAEAAALLEKLRGRAGGKP
jgi:tetratricopeptide (TPR) repeat protein